MTVEELIEKLQNLPHDCMKKKVLIAVDGEWGGVEEVSEPQYKTYRDGTREYDGTVYCKGDEPLFCYVEKNSYIWLIGPNY